MASQEPAFDVVAAALRAADSLVPAGATDSIHFRLWAGLLALVGSSEEDDQVANLVSYVAAVMHEGHAILQIDRENRSHGVTVVYLVRQSPGILVVVPDTWPALVRENPIGSLLAVINACSIVADLYNGRTDRDELSERSRAYQRVYVWFATPAEVRVTPKGKPLRDLLYERKQVAPQESPPEHDGLVAPPEHRILGALCHALREVDGALDKKAHPDGVERLWLGMAIILGNPQDQVNRELVLYAHALLWKRLAHITVDDSVQNVEVTGDEGNIVVRIPPHWRSSILRDPFGELARVFGACSYMADLHNGMDNVEQRACAHMGHYLRSNSPTTLTRWHQGLMAWPSRDRYLYVRRPIEGMDSALFGAVPSVDERETGP